MIWKGPPTPTKEIEESVGQRESREIESKRPRLCNTEEVPNETEGSEDTFTITPTILSRLKEMGIKTRVRKLSRLLDIYNIAMQSH